MRYRLKIPYPMNCGLGYIGQNLIDKGVELVVDVYEDGTTIDVLDFTKEKK